MLKINTNLSSLVLQHTLNRNTNGLNRAIERMTTGYKINHAKDNAADFSINTKLSTKISAYNVAEENATMGIDMIDTAFGSLDLISDKLSRLTALSLQSRNYIYGFHSQVAIQKEADAIIQEINRIYSSTEYNGINLFETSGSFIKQVTVRDTSSMIDLSEIDENLDIIDGVYSISSAKELEKLAQMTNSGKIQGGEFVLAASIDLSEYTSWTPIGMSEASAFKASFDGNGYVIQNLVINSVSAENKGLFGFVNGNISNLGVKEGRVVAGNTSALLAAQVLSGKIYNCYSTGEVNGGDNTAGLIGFYHSGMVEGCYSVSTVHGNINVGGLVGHANSSLLNCYSVTETVGNQYVGGLIGVSSERHDILNCYSKGRVKGNTYVGGIKGSSNASGSGSTLVNSFFEGNVSGNTYVGGLIGNDAYNAIKNSYVKGKVEGKTKTAGISGNKWNGIIENCYADLEVSSSVNAVFVASVQGKTDVNNSFYNSECDDRGIPHVLGNARTLNIQAFSLEPPFTLDTLIPIAKGNSVSFCIGINAAKSSMIELSTDFDITSELYNLMYFDLNSDDYLNSIENITGKIHAQTIKLSIVQNRLSSALEQIQISHDNLIYSQSVIKDADVAVESSEYIRYQILQQATATLLTTANQTPTIALQLI